MHDEDVTMPVPLTLRGAFVLTVEVPQSPLMTPQS